MCWAEGYSAGEPFLDDILLGLRSIGLGLFDRSCFYFHLIPCGVGVEPAILTHHLILSHNSWEDDGDDNTFCNVLNAIEAFAWIEWHV